MRNRVFRIFAHNPRCVKAAYYIEAHGRAVKPMIDYLFERGFSVYVYRCSDKLLKDFYIKKLQKVDIIDENERIKEHENWCGEKLFKSNDNEFSLDNMDSGEEDDILKDLGIDFSSLGDFNNSDINFFGDENV